jgi:hypothetical protein
LTYDFSAWIPPSAGYSSDYDFNMIHLMAMIIEVLNHGHQVNHLKIIVKKVAATPPTTPCNPRPQGSAPVRFQQIILFLNLTRRDFCFL